MADKFHTEDWRERAKEAFAKANARRVIIRQQEHTVLSVPLGWAVIVVLVASVVAPPVPMVALVLLFVTHASLTIEDDPTTPAPPTRAWVRDDAPVSDPRTSPDDAPRV